MCGLIGVYVANPKRIKEKLKKIYNQQKHRGQSGYGAVVIKKNGNTLYRYRCETEKAMFSKQNGIWGKIQATDLILFHHRTPTSTKNQTRQNHPILTENKSIALIHNGMIYNDSKLYEEHRKKGHIYETYEEREIKEVITRKYYKNNEFVSGKPEYEKKTEFDYNDSETIAHEIEEIITAYQNKKIQGKYPNLLKQPNTHYINQKLAKKLTGQYAILYVMSNNHSIRVFAYSNPLIAYSDKQGNHWISSEHDHTLNSFIDANTVKDLLDGESGVINAKGFESKGQVIIPASTYSCYNTSSVTKWDNTVWNSKTKKWEHEKNTYGYNDTELFPEEVLDHEEILFYINGTESDKNEIRQQLLYDGYTAKQIDKLEKELREYKPEPPRPQRKPKKKPRWIETYDNENLAYK